MSRAGPKITIRPYTDADYPLVQKNLQAADMFEEVSEGRDNLASIIADEFDAMLVVEVDGELAGSIVTTPFGKNIALAWRFNVAEKFRGMGVGSQLLEAAETMLKEKGYEEIWGFMDVTQSELADYYTKRGFRYNPDHRYFAIWKNLSKS